MADDIPVGSPIAVTLLEKDFYDSMAKATGLSGVCMLSASCAVSPTECFQLLGLNVTEEDDVPMIVVNGLPTALSRGVYLDDHSVQKQYPVITDGSGGTTFKPDVIPGSRAHPSKAGATLCGAGAYCFSKSSGFFWNDGAMSFNDTDGNLKFAIAWSCESGAGFAAVTTDLSDYGSSLQTFYDGTVNKNTSINSATGTDYTVTVSTGTVTLMLFNPNPSGNRYDPYNVTYLIVAVRPK